MAARSITPLVVIVGPTASGKTALAIEVARQVDGEIICADSRTVYRGMDIGTAKPTAQEQATVPHWGLDIADPSETFTVVNFKKYAEKKIEEIRSRGHVPFLVGGSGLYIDAVLFDYQFGSAADPQQRVALQSMTLDQLHEYCQKHNVTLPENSKNKRYVIRAIEQQSVNVRRRKTPISNSIIVGIATEKEKLRQRIEQRAEQLFDDGVVEEASLLGKKYGWDSGAMTGNIYPLVHSYLLEESTLDEVKKRFVTLDWRLAKRQLTWFRRNSYIRWMDRDAAKTYLFELLAKE